jgi:hypothetical protein
MIWQDIVITSASIIFSLALLPQAYYGFKEKTCPIKPQTSLPTFLGLYAVSFSFFTLSLLFSSIITFITGSIWFLLFAQSLLYKK